MSQSTLDTQAERSHLLALIEAKADPSYRQVIQRSVPSRLRVYGLRVFEIRQILRDWRREHKDVALRDLLSLVQALWDGESREERLLALELLRHYPASIAELTWRQLDDWRKDSDNWELIDVLGLGVLGPWIAFDAQERATRLWDLLAREDVWSRRLGLVATLGLERSETVFDSAALALELVDQCREERDPKISKAVSWVLRDLSRNHSDVITAYLEENEALLAPHVVREVTNKLTTGRKSGSRKR